MILTKKAWTSREISYSREDRIGGWGGGGCPGGG